MTQPSRLTFWRSVLLLSAILLFLAIWDFIRLANDLDVVILHVEQDAQFVVNMAFQARCRCRQRQKGSSNLYSQGYGSHHVKLLDEFGGGILIR